MMHIQCRIICTSLMMLVILSEVSPGNGQQRSLQEQERQLLLTKARIDSLEAIQTHRLEEAESLARQIKLIRSKEILSSSEHRSLQRQLLESQRLETLVTELENRIEKLERSFRSAIDTFIHRLQAEILTVLDDIEQGDGTEDIDRFQSLLLKRSQWEVRLTPPPFRGRRNLHVKAEAWDSPGILEVKGDLLLDQEEALRDEVKTIENRLQSLEEEESVRRKVNELTRNIYFFDEREELMGKGIRNPPVALSQETYSSSDRSPIETPDPQTSSAFYETIQRVLTGPTPRSPDELKTWIRRLRQYRELIEVRADSLHQRAVWFYNEAKSRRE